MDRSGRVRRVSVIRGSWYAVFAIAVSLACLACATGSGVSGDEWSRHYVTTYERAWEAAAEALTDIDFYLVSDDPKRGRIRARSSARRGDLESTLFVDIRQSNHRIRVDVMAQSPGLEEGRAPVQVSGIIRDFFDRLDSRLEGRID